MIAVLQRVSHAKVDVDGQTVGKCAGGLMILLGVADGDTEKDADVLSTKIAKLRIFNDQNDKMNLSLLDVGGEALVISNFSLLANYKHGNRPDYMSAAAPAIADSLYEYFCEKLSENIGKPVGKGIFGAEMKVELLNDGPITIVMDSKVLIKN
jgi:D-tyrosyl-tRNA(Tyr) deacylase